MKTIDGEANVLITNFGANPWDIHLGQSGVKLEKGKKYEGSFDATASAVREISVIVGRNSEPWTVYNGENTVILYDRRTTYNFDFVMQDETDTAARLGFDVGGQQEDVVIDNVFLSQGVVETSSLSPKKIDSKNETVLSNFPNPFSTKTCLHFVVKEANSARIEIYSSLGVLVEILQNSFLSPGEYDIWWHASEFPAGIYFAKYSFGKEIYVIKLQKHK